MEMMVGMYNSVGNIRQHPHVFTPSMHTGICRWQHLFF